MTTEIPIAVRGDISVPELKQVLADPTVAGLTVSRVYKRGATPGLDPETGIDAKLQKVAEELRDIGPQEGVPQDPSQLSKKEQKRYQALQRKFQHLRKQQNTEYLPLTYLIVELVVSEQASSAAIAAHLSAQFSTAGIERVSVDLKTAMEPVDEQTLFQRIEHARTNPTET